MTAIRYVILTDERVVNATMADPESLPNLSAGERWLASDNAQIGWAVGTDGQPVAPPEPSMTADEAMTVLRAERDAKLRASDWTQLPDAALSGVSKSAWVAYRQALRGLPEATPDPASPEWPAPPAQG